MVADALGVPLDHIEVVHGNTDVVPYGMGTFGSRSLAVGGAAVQMSVEKIKDKAKQLAAYMLDVRPEDVTYGPVIGECYARLASFADRIMPGQSPKPFRSNGRQNSSS